MIATYKIIQVIPYSVCKLCKTLYGIWVFDNECFCRCVLRIFNRYLVNKSKRRIHRNYITVISYDMEAPTHIEKI